jgi:hypothetical protein
MRILRTVLILSFFLVTNSSFASDWPQYLGPDRNEEWTFSNEAPGSVSYDGTRAVPTIDGNRIYNGFLWYLAFSLLFYVSMKENKTWI